MAHSVSAKVDAWVKETKQRAKAVLQQSTQELISEAQRVGPSVENPTGGEGGKMPIATGFLRASMAISFDGMPTGPDRGEGKAPFSYNDSEVTLRLAGVEVGKTIYAGWTARYAKYVEERYGFMRSAAQNWQAIVDRVTAKAKAGS